MTIPIFFVGNAKFCRKGCPHGYFEPYGRRRHALFLDPFWINEDNWWLKSLFYSFLTRFDMKGKLRMYMTTFWHSFEEAAQMGLIHFQLFASLCLFFKEVSWNATLHIPSLSQTASLLSEHCPWSPNHKKIKKDDIFKDFQPRYRSFNCEIWAFQPSYKQICKGCQTHLWCF